MRISIASYAFHGLVAEGMMDVFGYLETVRHRYRLDTADIWNGMLPSTEESYLAKVREALDERELTLVNLCVDGAHIWEPDPAEREALHRAALAHLNAAVVLGAQTVRIDMGGTDREMSQEQFDHTVARYREYADFAVDHGFRVGPENHWGPETWIDNMVRVSEAVDHPGYGILLHVGSWAGDSEEGDRLAAPWTMHTHVDANTTATCFGERMQILLDAGYEGYWGVEHHSGRNEYAEVEWQLAEVRRTLSRLRLASR